MIEALLTIEFDVNLPKWIKATVFLFFTNSIVWSIEKRFFRLCGPSEPTVGWSYATQTSGSPNYLIWGYELSSIAYLIHTHRNVIRNEKLMPSAITAGSSSYWKECFKYRKIFTLLSSGDLRKKFFQRNEIRIGEWSVRVTILNLHSSYHVVEAQIDS